VAKRDLGARIKARLGEWENYGDGPVAATVVGSDSKPSLNERTAGVDLDESGVVVYDPITHGDWLENSDPRIPKAQVAELQAALEHERDQSRRLMDMVAREQVLRAVTLQSQRQHTPSRQARDDMVRPDAPTQVTTSVRPRHPRSSNAAVSPRSYALLIMLALFIAVACAALAFTLVR
jgi:hypothetical protein